ncbi:LAME_0G08834g1_1 [Lachancea meyersii CBS 8951]|uniref:LAME_0G08834g1_1 n=1 Tax=Lachancea meyersii CBS 8951 TaxID=1266667 RepID=A0A1G4K8D8_9SACH|nr:LAME_0G08834g1_1 [Lachancea meyersii CBS 8951]
MRNEFKKVPLNSNRDFSWVFLIDWILILSISLLAAFYFGRAFGFTITTLLEWFLWRRCSVKIQIQSLKISFLGGRVFFKNLTIITQNQTVSFVNGSLTWRYWLFSSRQTSYERQKCGVSGEDSRPCRFKLECQGLEHFVYNKTQAFSQLWKSLSKSEQARFKQFEAFSEDDQKSFHSTTSSSLFSISENSNENSNSDSSLKSSTRSSASLPSFLKVLPLEVAVQRGAVVVGNKSTSSILILSYDKLAGIVEVGKSNSKLDLYKLQTRCDFDNFCIRLKPNLGFRVDAPLKNLVKPDKVTRLWHKSIEILLKAKSGKFHDIYHAKQHAFQTLQNPLEDWKGLGLYRKTDDAAWDDTFKFDVSKHQYARYTKIMKCEKLVLDYSFDVPGVTPRIPSPSGGSTSQAQSIVDQSESPPDYSIDIQLFGATIHYGPWAHHEVMPIQRMFSPIVSKDSEPFPNARAGSERIYMRAKFSITIMSSTIWRLPTREPSKDLDFLKRYRETQDDSRSFGWLEIVLSRDSELTFDFAMSPTSSGFENFLDLHLVKPELRTSVNHDILFSADTNDLHAEIGYPLGWNQMAIWNFALTSTQAQLFILKDHVSLLADLISDFGTGQNFSYELFRPFIYNIKWEFRGYSIYLNVNDANIVNNPVDFNENCYLSFHGDDLRVDLTVPQTSIAGNSTNIDYKLQTSLFRLRINTPSWNTLHEFMNDQEVGRSHDFTMAGSYLFHTNLDVDNIDTILINCHCRKTTLKCYGFVVRYLIGVKMNYFGDFVHFKTTEEYMEELKGDEKGTKTASAAVEDFLHVIDPRSGKGSGSPQALPRDASPSRKFSFKRLINEKDVWFTFIVDDGCLVVPHYLYDCESCFAFQFDSLNIDIRDLNYYMDLQTSFSPVKIRRQAGFDFDTHFNHGIDKHDEKKPEGHITDVQIHAHRLYGLPPNEETYVCKWDFTVGQLKTSSDLLFPLQLAAAMKKLVFGFKDFENIMNYKFADVLDLTSITFVIGTIEVEIQNTATNHTIEIRADQVMATFVDLENASYTSRADIEAPNLSIKILEGGNEECPVALFDTSFKVTNFAQVKDFQTHTRQQKAHIAANDAPFHRCPFLLPFSIQNSEPYNELLGCIPPGVSIPSLTMPLQGNSCDEFIEGFLDGEEESTIETLTMSSSSKISTTLVRRRGHQDTRIPLISENTFLEYDEPSKKNSMIANIPKVTLQLDPECFVLIESLMNQVFSNFVDHLIDCTEVEIVWHFIKTKLGEKCLLNLELFCPDFELVLGELYRKSECPKKVEISVKELIVNTSFMENVQQNEREGGISTEEDGQQTTYMKFKSAELGIVHNPGKSQHVANEFLLFSCTKDLELWVSSSTYGLVSVNTHASDTSINPRTLDQLCAYLQKLTHYFDALSQVIMHHGYLTKNAQKEFFYQIARASEEYQIIHDPPVITKPAYITRLPSQHVREDRSWKIVTRLRHILNYLPSPLISEIYDNIKKFHFEAPKNAGERFLILFSKWRSWEFSDFENGFFYQQSFTGRKLSRLSLSDFDVRLKIGVLSFTLSSGIDEDGDTIILKNIETRRSQSRKIDDDRPDYAIKSDGKVSEKNLIGSVKVARISVSESSLALLTLGDLLSKSQESDGISNDKGKSVPAIFQAVLLIDRCELQLLSGTKKINFKSFGNSLAFASSEESQMNSATASWSWFELGIRHRDAILLDVFSRSGTLGTLFTLQSEILPKVVNLQLQKLRIKLPSASASYIAFAKSAKDLHKTTKARFKRTAEAMGKPRKSFSPRYDTSESKAEVKIEDLSFEMSAISPFVFSKRVHGLNLLLDMRSERLLHLIFEGLDFDVGPVSGANQYFKFSQSKFDSTISGWDSKSSKRCSISIDSEITKLKLCEPVNLLRLLVEDLDVARKSLGDMLKTIKALNVINEEAETSTDSQPKLFSGQWAFALKAKYIGLLLPLRSVSYICELNELCFAASSDENASENGKGPSEHVQGKASVASIAFLINDSALSEKLSKLVDFGVSVKIAQGSGKIVKSLEIESSHLRLVFCPQSLTRLLVLVSESSKLASKYAQSKQATNEDTGVFAGAINLPKTFQSVHILSYNVCLGWMFDVEGATHPGLIWGYQRLFAAHEWPFGKLTILDAYFSIARGHAAHDFFALESELNKPNRSFLPSTQLGYWFENNGSTEDLFVRVNGEQLDVSFLSTSTSVADGLTKSLHAFDELKKKHLASGSASEDVIISTTSKVIRFPGISRLGSVNCKARYAGGVFKLYSEKDLDLGLDPSFQMESPSVEVVIDYRFCPSQDRRHVVRSFVNVEKSHNTIFPTCVPILGEIARDTSRMMKSFNASPVSVPRSQVQESVNYKNLLKDFDISFQTHIDQQLISLSCDPKAKVQADVGFENLVIKIFTNNLDTQEPLSLSLDIKNVTATSRHIFSREISTSIKIDRSSFVFILTHTDLIRTYGVVLVPNIDVFFNFKQLQDLNVFLNIWKVDSKVLSQPESEDKGSFIANPEKSLAAKHRKISSNSSFPWNFVMIISKIKGEIDLGVSLGVISLSTESLRAVTDHFRNWTQRLSLQLERVFLSSNGRLGGTVLLRDFNWISQICWPIHNGKFQNPLIALDVGLAEFAVKLSFDYHLILIASLERFKLIIFNKREAKGLFKNLLAVSLHCGSTNIFATALAPANILDVYNTILRMRKENKKSYFETLGDSNTRDTKHISSSREILDSLSFLRTDLEVRLDFINTQIFPNTLFDMEVLTFRAADLVTRSQIEGYEKLKTQLNWQVHNVKFALSTYKSQLHEKDSSEIGVKEYIEHAAKAHGGTILVIPAILVGMTTWHDVATNTVELLYSNSFGGKISVRWNLGSINFLREMWATHVRALALRRSHNQQPRSFFEDEHLEDKLRDVDLGAKYTYVPLEDPHIEIPKTKDLGNATPPIEWFGVNRKHFPGMTHQGIIIPLQKLAHLGEVEWTRIFGSA